MRYGWTKAVVAAATLVSASAARGVPITGPNGGIQSASTTANLNTVNGGCIGPGAADCTIDGDFAGGAGTFVEFNIQGGETFSYTLDGLYDVTMFLLWNDRGAPDSGIDGFTLVFHGLGGPTIYSNSAAANRGNNPAPEVFDVGLHIAVSAIDLIVLTGHNRNTQFREVEFDGVRSSPSVPEPGTALVMLVGLLGVVAGRRRARARAHAR